MTVIAFGWSGLGALRILLRRFIGPLRAPPRPDSGDLLVFRTLLDVRHGSQLWTTAGRARLVGCGRRSMLGSHHDHHRGILGAQPSRAQCWHRRQRRGIGRTFGGSDFDNSSCRAFRMALGILCRGHSGNCDGPVALEVRQGTGRSGRLKPQPRATR